MKPRISPRRGIVGLIWVCVSTNPFRFEFGYTPEEAYRNWKSEAAALSAAQT
jgi:hypothetical protein